VHAMRAAAERMDVQKKTLAVIAQYDDVQKTSEHDAEDKKNDQGRRILQCMITKNPPKRVFCYI
jgi:hypothetical protein